MFVIQQLINALSIGSIYALVAIGYTMVYGIIKLINFAHGDMLMVGAYVAYFGIVVFGLPLYVVIPLSVVVCGILGFVIERIAYKPLRQSTRIAALITAIGVSYLLQNLMILAMGTNVLTFPMDLIESLNQGIVVGGIAIAYKQILVLGLTIASVVLLQIIVKKTRIGRAMRACSTDVEAARLMGINVDFTVSVTFMIGSAFAGLAGALIGIFYNSVSPMMGVTYGLKAFVAAVFGGIGLIPGAMVGGYGIGLMETLVVMGNYSTIKDAVVYSVLILVLIVKPSGLLGKNLKEKV